MMIFQILFISANCVLTFGQDSSEEVLIPPSFQVQGPERRFDFHIPSPHYDPPKYPIYPQSNHFDSHEIHIGRGKESFGLGQHIDPHFGHPNPLFQLPLSHKTPVPHYGPPKPHYGPPASHYGPPVSHHEQPAPHYGPPDNQHFDSSSFEFGHPDLPHHDPVLGFLPPKLNINGFNSKNPLSIGGSYSPHSHQAVCHPKYITKYETKLKEVPIYKTLVSKAYVPTPIYQTQYSTHYVTKHQTDYISTYVTTTKYIPQVKYVTEYQTDHHTAYKTKYVPSKVHVPKYVTKSLFLTKHVTDVVYQTSHHTEYQPKYVTHTVYHTDVKHKKEYVPTYVTVTKHKAIYKTACPQKGY